MAETRSATSSMTSTSHTLTGQPFPNAAMAGSTAVPSAAPKTNGVAPAAIATSAVSQSLLDALRPENRHLFVHPTQELANASLRFVKVTLDSFAGKVADEQTEALKRWQKYKRKGKRKHNGDDDEEEQDIVTPGEVLKIRRITVDGFPTEQVWQQARRVIDAALGRAEVVIRRLDRQGLLEKRNEDEEMADGEDDEVIEPAEEGAEEDADTDEASDDGDEDNDGIELDGLEDEEDQEDLDDEDEDPKAEHDLSDEEEDEDEEFGDDAKPFVQDKHGLNDEFFSIDEFNKQTQWFEEQDARGDPNTDQVSEDEALDWHADPLSIPEGKANKVAKSGKSARPEKGEDFDFGFDEEENESEDEEDDETGPTFGNMKLDAPEGASDDEMDDQMDAGDIDDGMDLTADDVFYKDFFAPPARKQKKGYIPKAMRDNQAVPEEREIERAMEDVRHDLFSDESEHSGSEEEIDALSDVSAGDPKSRRSAHERRQAKLAQEIQRLEAESVAKRAWTLSGEAGAADRPLNSLLEEDMDFEHAGKPIPVATEEVSETIEALIKRRILAQEFDEVLRRRPDAATLANGTAARRGLIELDDSKSKKGLAEIYEEEHVKTHNPDTYVSASDERLRKEETEVQNLWKAVSASLDTLSSWHYRPRPVEPTIAVVTDVPVVAMEDAQPTTASGIAGGESRVAPQEVYRPGEKGTVEKGELVTHGGAPVAREEMSREEKTARRRREKERRRKGGVVNGGGKEQNVVGANGQGKGKKAQEQKETLAQLQKGGVRVINRKGEVVDLAGKKAKTGVVASGGSYKL